MLFTDDLASNQMGYFEFSLIIAIIVAIVVVGVIISMFRWSLSVILVTVCILTLYRYQLLLTCHFCS